jgi:hypothetical protein
LLFSAALPPNDEFGVKVQRKLLNWYGHKSAGKVPFDDQRRHSSKVAAAAAMLEVLSVGQAMDQTSVAYRG